MSSSELAMQAAYLTGHLSILVDRLMTTQYLFPLDVTPAAEAPVPIGPRATRRKAAEEIRPSAKSLRERVLEFIRGRAGFGATDEEIRDGLEIRSDTARARRCELRDASEICDSGRTRNTRSGRPAVVWVPTACQAGARPDISCEMGSRGRHNRRFRDAESNAPARCPSCGRELACPQCEPTAAAASRR